MSEKKEAKKVGVVQHEDRTVNATVGTELTGHAMSKELAAANAKKQAPKAKKD